MTRSSKNSMRLYSQASKLMVGGVSSPVRAFRAVGGVPLFIERGSGPFIWDADGNRFTDYVCSWGALIHGHANAVVSKNACHAVRRGSSFGAPTVQELELARSISGRVKSIRKIRFVNSGTEATMSAVRLARAYTRRKKILKFEGCYHGHADMFLSKAGSGLATLSISASPGVPPEVAVDTITVPYNDKAAAERAFGRFGDEIAAVIVEPVAGNMGVVPPSPGFLSELRGLTREHGSLLIFDEVITGFRVARGGAQALYGISPDLTCLGKIIGCGFPVGAYGGRSDIMEMVAPEGPVYQAGTLSGNPVAMSAGAAALSLLNASAYRKLDAMAARLEDGIADGAARAGVELKTNRVGSMIGIFFSDHDVTNFSQAVSSNVTMFKEFFWRVLNSGVYMPPSPFETLFVSTAHDPSVIDSSVEAFSRAFNGLGRTATSSIAGREKHVFNR